MSKITKIVNIKIDLRLSLVEKLIRGVECTIFSSSLTITSLSSSTSELLTLSSPLSVSEIDKKKSQVAKKSWLCQSLHGYLTQVPRYDPKKSQKHLTMNPEKPKIDFKTIPK